MRNVTKQIAAAFRANKSKTVGNTRTDGNAVYLHGNKIIERRGTEVWARLAGWNTPTTRERLNGILGAGFHQKDFSPYLNGQLIDSREWYRIES